MQNDCPNHDLRIINWLHTLIPFKYLHPQTTINISQKESGLRKGRKKKWRSQSSFIPGGLEREREKITHKKSRRLFFLHF